MSNIQQALGAEIQRLARKEIKVATADLKKISSSHRSAIADLRRRIANLEKENKRLLRGLGKAQKAPKEDAPEEVEKARITAKMILSTRKRLGLPRKDFAKLVGASPGSVFQWERKEGRLQFRGGMKAKIIEARKMTKAEAKKRLAT